MSAAACSAQCSSHLLLCIWMVGEGGSSAKNCRIVPTSTDWHYVCRYDRIVDSYEGTLADETRAGRSIETANSSGVLWSTDIGGCSYLLQRLFYKVWFELSEPTDSGKVAGDESVVDGGLLGPMSVV